MVSCGKIHPSGNKVQRDIPLKTLVKSIDAEGKFRLFYSPSHTKTALTLEGSDNVLNNLKITQKGDELFIKEERSVVGEDLYHLTIYTPKMPIKVTLKDSIEYNLSGNQIEEKLFFQLKGYSKILGNISAHQMNLEMADHTAVNFTGATSYANISTTGNASIIAPFWFIERAVLKASDSSYIEINPQSSLEGVAKGESKIQYISQPKIIMKKLNNAKIIKRKS